MQLVYTSTPTDCLVDLKLKCFAPCKEFFHALAFQTVALLCLWGEEKQGETDRGKFLHGEECWRIACNLYDTLLRMMRNWVRCTTGSVENGWRDFLIDGLHLKLSYLDLNNHWQKAHWLISMKFFENSSWAYTSSMEIMFWKLSTSISKCTCTANHSLWIILNSNAVEFSVFMYPLNQEKEHFYVSSTSFLSFLNVHFRVPEFLLPFPLQIEWENN